MGDFNLIFSYIEFALDEIRQKLNGTKLKIITLQVKFLN